MSTEKKLEKFSVKLNEKNEMNIKNTGGGGSNYSAKRIRQKNSQKCGE